MDYNKIKEAAQNYEADMTKFLRELVHFPGESCGEKDHVMRIKEEMEKLGFDKVVVDPMGNILGYMGTGSTLIGFDAHIDTVGIGNRDNWEFDPYEGFETETEIGGRGTAWGCEENLRSSNSTSSKEVCFFPFRVVFLIQHFYKTFDLGLICSIIFI